MPKIFEASFYTVEQLKALNEEDLIFPFSTEYMRYDGLKQQYIPTEELLNKHGIDLKSFLASTGRNTPTDINEELEYISDQIYTCIFKNSGSNIDTLKCMVAKGIRRGISPYRFRLIFEEILWKQARFYVNNDDPTKTTGIDMEQKQWLNKGVLINEDRQIDPQVKVMLMQLGLSWVGSYDKMFFGLVSQKNW